AESGCSGPSRRSRPSRRRRRRPPLSSHPTASWRTTARALTADVDTLAAALDPTDTRALAQAPRSLAAAALRNWLRDDDGHPPSTAELDRALAVVRHEAVGCELSGGRRLRRRDGRLRLDGPEQPDSANDRPRGG
ncbi:MAG: TilS substrate-binding domain-containing protein, partial [Actinomycetota bacterium]